MGRGGDHDDWTGTNGEPNVQGARHHGADRRERDALRAAQLYYVQDLTMEAIARDLGVSRSTVSRLLSLAKRTGLVKIELDPPRGRATSLVRDLEDRYGVRAQVVPTDGSLSEAEVLERVAAHAAHVVQPLISSGMTVGLAWGSTLSALSKHLVHKPTHDTVFVQLNGAANPLTTGISYASDILFRFGTAFTARVEQFPVPAFFDRAETRAAMWQERSVIRVLDTHRKIRLAVFGLGSIDSAVPSQIYRGGYVSTQEARALREQGVVGDVATVFYRSDGSDDDIAMNDRSTGPRLADLRRIPQRLAVVAGRGKLAALRGALEGRLMTDLVVDEGTAWRLLR
ncbi:sugar-binding transcriptional regulator [Arthrobacter sp. JSM 101049]|uniref:sugar-binding transcriptional regulator n=1 Tax=Arthrobacter sp. JSM 101049 TaxID=929097 RepID=UPI003562F516